MSVGSCESGDPIEPDFPEGYDSPISPWVYRVLLGPIDPSDIESLTIPKMTHDAACARLDSVCGSVRKLINNLVPAFLPIAGDRHGPPLGGEETRFVLDDLLSRIDLTWGEWIALSQILTREAKLAMRIIAATIKELGKRWRRDEAVWDKELREAVQLSRESGTRPHTQPRPERTITSEELESLKQVLPLLAEEVGRGAALLDPVPPPGDDNSDQGWLICSQAALARELGYGPHYTGLIEKLKNDGIIKKYERRGPKSLAVIMTDRKRHADLKARLARPAKQPRRPSTKS
jgi:hypothetical protein